MLLKNVSFFNELFEKEAGDILIENGRISEIGIIDGEGEDMSGLVALPGFVDIHIHGAAGGDACDASAESLDKISAYLAGQGVTSFCPTTMTLGRDALLKIVASIRDYKGNEAGAKVAGINLEGPFIAPSKKGAQNGDFVREGTAEEFDELLEASGKLVKLITIAPEAFESEGFIRHAAEKCTVSIGHSAANAQQTKTALQQGAAHFTHLYNAMTPMTHREAGIVGTALDSNATCELICDGEHICETVLRNSFKILGENRACVISDSMRAAAASITNLYQEFKNLLNFGIDFKAALKSCTINPARVIGADGEIGSIAPGKAADLVFVDENLEIKRVYINGTLA
jgi:N-acetylglucosamine-6-phosphate deacetylase